MSPKYDCCEHCEHFEDEMTGPMAAVAGDGHDEPCIEGCNADQAVST